MFKGYNLSLSNDDIDRLGGIADKSISAVTNSLSSNKEVIRNKSEVLLEKGFLNFSVQNNKGDLDGIKLIEEWFPDISADVFISHSHKDEKLAINLATWLYDNFGLISFIDSTVWGYSNELLKELDNIYCLNENGETYNYDKRNLTTSHVHMMLSTALNKMIDRTECMFFLNTSNSINDNNQTYSPWLYSELATFSIVEKKDPRNTLEMINKMIFESKQSVEQRNFNIKYEADLSNLRAIDWLDLLSWQQRNKNRTKGSETLDLLYYYYLIMEENDE